MFKSIRIKLFLTLLLAIIVVVAGMYWFMRDSFDRGFSDFVESRQKKSIENLVAHLTEHYDSHQQWQALANDKKKWVNLVWAVNDHRHPQYPPPWIKEALKTPGNTWPPQPPEYYERNRDGGERRHPDQGPNGNGPPDLDAFPPPPPPLEGKFRPHLMPLEMRLMLLDADKRLIFGREELAGQLSLTPIYHAGQVVGYLGLLPGPPLKQIADIQFMEQQANELVWIALGMVLLSAALALLIAYLLGRPLKRITAASKALAIGQYETRLSVDSDDELGQLARDFNDLAAALAQAEQTRQNWVADISHELRTPLSVLRGELEALQDGVRPLSQGAVDSLYGDVMRLSRLAEDLYQLALSDQGALSYRKALIDPVGILFYDVSVLAAEFQRKAIAVTIDSQEGKPLLIYADPDRLSQLYRNLLHNTLHYTDMGGALQVAISRQQDALVMDFADSEPGIPNEALAKLFERFYRVESSRNRSLGGAGLGLSICRNIVEAHNGHITALHSALGGLTIRITLPLAL